MKVNKIIFDYSDPECHLFLSKISKNKTYTTSFRKQFKYIRAFHSSRIDQAEHSCIDEEGILLTSSNTMCNKLLNRVISYEDPDEIQKENSYKITEFYKKRFKENYYPRLTYFALDKRIFDRDYHYYVLRARIVFRY